MEVVPIQFGNKQSLTKDVSFAHSRRKLSPECGTAQSIGFWQSNGSHVVP